jgi:hypothetical protein
MAPVLSTRHSSKPGPSDTLQPGSAAPTTPPPALSLTADEATSIFDVLCGQPQKTGQEGASTS